MRRTRFSRKYPPKTIKLLFGLSRGQCAVPDCENPIVQPQGENCDAAVLGQICHIYARSPDGPRSDGGLSDDELNKEPNLIVLCGHHHIDIDANPEIYTADKLKQMKRDHWQNTQDHAITSTPLNIQTRTSFPTAIIDKQIDNDFSALWKCQFYLEFNTVQRANILATKILQGEYFGASDHVKSKALSWCARYLSVAAPYMAKADQCLNCAKELSDDPHIDVAEAFLLCNSQNKDATVYPGGDGQTPSSISAYFYLIKIQKGVDQAIEWLDRTQTMANHLDSLGKLALLTSYLDTENWSAAMNTAKAVGDEDLESLPILNHLLGLVHLIAALADEFKPLVLVTVPINAASLPIAADRDSVSSLQTAVRYFHNASSSAKELDCPKAARSSQLYAMWLELMDHSSRPDAEKTLEAEFAGSRVPLHLVSLAVQFGVQIDVHAVEREIERQVALNGKLALEATAARFSLAYQRKGSEEFADYIDLHYDSLCTSFQPKFLRFTQIIVLTSDGEKARSREHLKTLLTSDIQISHTEELYLRSLVDASSDEALVSLEVDQFRKSDSVADLGKLVDKLESLQKWDDLCAYSNQLFERTHAQEDAERHAIALRNCNRHQELITFLRSQEYIVNRSWNLSMLYCWSILDEGEILVAQEMFSKLERRNHDPYYRHLEVLIAIKTGQWNSLLSFTESEFTSRYERTAEELLNAASLADALGSPLTKDLIFAAAASGPDDPKVLSSAYGLATRNGWEEDERVMEWFTTARRLSTEDGPITQLNFDEFVSLLPKWQRTESDILALIERGDVPIFSALERLHRSLSDLVMISAWSNLGEARPQHRIPIPTYSGSRPPQTFSTELTIGFDFGALLIIDFLDLLEIVFRSIKSIRVPYCILSWLFEEKVASRSHQPSRVADARQLQQFLLDNTLERVVPTSTPDSDLADEVGDDLAMLIAEAKESSGNNDVSRLVVRSAPVTSVQISNRDTVDLEEYHDVLVSCTTVVEKLRSLGVLTETERLQAVTYLSSQEEQWPDGPEIPRTCELYLDSLAVWYFVHLKLIPKIRSAGFRILVPASLVSTASSLVSRYGMISRVQMAIENIRDQIVAGVHRGNVKIDRLIDRVAEGEDEDRTLNLIRSLFSMSESCDLLISDDRFFNRNIHLGNSDKNALIASSLSLIDSLSESADISPQKKFECLTRLRQGGFLFVPVSYDELCHYLQFDGWREEPNSETAELRAIRESLLLARMCNALRAPEEVAWVDSVFRVFIQSVRSQWALGGDVRDIRSRANWVIRQLDVRGWAHKLRPDGKVEVSQSNHLTLLSMLFLRPVGLREDLIQSYWSWIDEVILADVKERMPDHYRNLVIQHRLQVFEIVDAQMRELRDRFGDVAGLDSEVARMSLDYFPPLIRESLLNDREYLQRFGSNVQQVVLLRHGSLRIRRDHLFTAVRQVLARQVPVVVNAFDGDEWSLEGEVDEVGLPVLYLKREGVRVGLPEFRFLSPTREVRIRSFEMFSRNSQCPSQLRKKWHKTLTHRSLRDEEIPELLEEFGNTLGFALTALRDEFKKSQVQVSRLVPSSKGYYENLVGAYRDGHRVDGYISGYVSDFLNELTRRGSPEFLSVALLLSAHSGLTKQISVSNISDGEFNRVVAELEQSGDRLSQLGAIEVGLWIVSDRPKIEKGILRLVEILRNDDGSQASSGFRLQASLFMLVEHELSVRRVFVHAPPFYRRLASLAHSSVIYRQVIRSGVDIGSFCDYIDSNFSLRFQLQSLVDMRVEPRWEPTFASTIYFRSEFLSRVIITAREALRDTDGLELQRVLLGSEESSLQAQAKFPSWYFAGPLEGGQESGKALIPELILDIETQSSMREITPQSFIAVIDAAFLGSITVAECGLVLGALKRGRYRLRKVENKHQLLNVLFGLARVSAYSRHSELAQSLRLVTRNYRNDREFPLAIHEELRIMLMSGACFQELEEWCEFVGNWITELAFFEFEDSESRKALHWSLQVLSDIVPALWSYCGAADAALPGDDVFH